MTGCVIQEMGKTLRQARTEMQEMAAEQRRASREVAERLQASGPAQHGAKHAPFTMLDAGMEAVPQDPAGIRSWLTETGMLGSNITM